DLERMVLAPLTPTAIALVDTQLDGYIKTKFGYLRDEERRAEIKGEWLIVMTFARKLMKEWRRKTFWLRFKNSGLVRPAVSCISCGHPLNANYNGRKGLACPRCGYNPYVTAFYACDCGSGAVLIRQPDISAFALVRDIYRVLREKEIRCTGCDESPRPEKLLQRMFILPIPYPIEDYTDENLIDWRTELGWRNAYDFKSPVDPKLTPREALLRTVDESSLKGFPYGESMDGNVE
ncbi:MAG: hypothetical protein LC808_16960, partial [Actinobacteria bacterium]|nr:hypothetical protein [Actinomycetota bacterium]